MWKLQKSVVNLAAPATYRFRVTFRWTGAGGHTLGTAVRYSPRCQQRELRPDLAVESIAVTPAPNNPGADVYTALIANAGNSAAGPFQVLFAPASGSGDQDPHRPQAEGPPQHHRTVRRPRVHGRRRTRRSRPTRRSRSMTSTAPTTR